MSLTIFTISKGMFLKLKDIILLPAVNNRPFSAEHWDVFMSKAWHKNISTVWRYENNVGACNCACMCWCTCVCLCVCVWFGPSVGGTPPCLLKQRDCLTIARPHLDTNAKHGCTHTLFSLTSYCYYPLNTHTLFRSPSIALNIYQLQRKTSQ